MIGPPEHVLSPPLLKDEYVLFAPPGTPLPAGVEHVEVDAPHYSMREVVEIGRIAARQRLDVFHAPHYVVTRISLPVVVTIHDLIHIHQAYTRQAEVAVILAKLHGKPICVTDHGGASSRIGVEFGSLDLVDRVVCQSEFAARMLRMKGVSSTARRYASSISISGPPVSPECMPLVIQ